MMKSYSRRNAATQVPTPISDNSPESATIVEVSAPGARLRELATFASVYFFLALISLKAKLTVTPGWFDGTLVRNHQLLLSFQYTNNEQSRLLQYYIPQALHRWLELSIPDAYILQRWVFVFLAFLGFHCYLRRWFGAGLAFAGVTFLAAVMPLSYFGDLQESAPLLLLTFLAGLWAIREHRTLWYAVILAVGALNNETMLILPAVFFLYELRSREVPHLLRLSALTLATSLPAFALSAAIRYATRDRPHLGGAWHWPDNVAGIWAHFGVSPLAWWHAGYLFIFFVFGAFWVFAFRKFADQPLFLRRAALVVPLFILVHLLTGLIFEVRQMLPLAYIIVPMALCTLFVTKRYDRPWQ